LLLEIIWARRLVWHAHDMNKLNEGQAGSRPGRNSIDVVIQKEMKYLYATLTRTGLAAMDNDAKSCYDRIIIQSRYDGVATLWSHKRSSINTSHHTTTYAIQNQNGAWRLQETL
jgi:hypothetical protein